MVTKIGTIMGPRDLRWSLDTMMGPLMVTMYNNGLQGQRWGLAEAADVRLQQTLIYYLDELSILLHNFTVNFKE